MATAVAAPRSPFAVIHVPGPRPEHHSFSHWMHRVVEELEQLRSAPEPDTVHDLRVAIRRCRSLAAVMEEVDPDPAWPQMRKAARKLFRGLGAVRDAEVLEEWIGKLGAEGDMLHDQLLSSLQSGQAQRSALTARLATKFDTVKWRRLEHQLRRRVRLIPVGGLAGECLALERLEQARELHNRALRSEKPKPWHALRIGLKKFRYTVEGFLPEHYAAWSKNLKRLQDLLGDIHDLDVLAEKLHELEASADSLQLWQHKILQQRVERVETYRQLTLGRTSLWNEWRHNLPHGRRLETAADARLRSTARAADARPRRTGQESRLALRIFSILGRLQAAPLFAEFSTLRMLRTAASLHGVSVVGGERVSLKATRKFLLDLPIPLNVTAEQWDLIAWAVRFHRGPEPKQKNGFAKLSDEQQNIVRAIAGTLRLARALRKTGIEVTTGLRSEKSADAFVLRVPGLADTAESAGRLAAAKHLLETVVGKPLILKPVPKPQPPQAASATASSSEPIPAPAAVASD